MHSEICYFLLQTHVIVIGFVTTCDKQVTSCLQMKLLTDEVRKNNWSTVLREEDSNLTLDVFNKLLMPVFEKHAPVRK